jgi:hypothetical protein
MSLVFRVRDAAMVVARAASAVARRSGRRCPCRVSARQLGRDVRVRDAAVVVAGAEVRVASAHASAVARLELAL